MKRTRVLWLTKGLGRGGAEMLLLSIARAIDRSQVDLEVAYTLAHKDALVHDLEALRIPVHSLGSRFSGGWTLELRRLLAASHYDVVHSHAPIVGAAARVLSPRPSALVHTEHNTWDRYHWATRLVNAATIGRNQVVWAVSDGVARSIKPRWPVRRPVVEVMLHGVDPTSARSGAHARAAAVERLGLSATGFTFGTVGNLTPKKDQATMLRAFAGVRHTLPDARLLIIGTGPREAQLRALARDLGIQDAVLFTGMRDDVQDLLPAFDVFVLSSLHEGLSIALVEALAAGVPVVATRVGGIPELITAGEHGLLVPPGDAAAVEQAMTRIAVDSDLRGRFAAAAPGRAAEFGIQPAADALADRYTRLGTERLLPTGARS